MKKLCKGLFLIPLALSLFACGKSNKTNSKDDGGYKVDISSDAISGVVSGKGNYNAGEKVVVSASAYEGYVFDGWYIGNRRVSNNYDYSFTMPSSNVNLRCSFVDDYFIYDSTDHRIITGTTDKSRENIVIPENVTTIKDAAVDFCKNAVNLTISNSVTTIEDNAFRYCQMLVSVTIGSSATYIGEDAFMGCEKIIEVYNLSTLDIRAKDEENKLSKNAMVVHTSIDDKSIITIDDEGFMFAYYDNKGYLVDYLGNTFSSLPTSFVYDNETINSYEIYYYFNHHDDNLTSLTIPNCVTKIGDEAFIGNNNLKTLVIGDGVKEIGKFAFADTGLENITIGSGVKIIMESSFGANERLFEIVIPNNVETIDANVFFGCDRLSRIVIGSGLKCDDELFLVGCNNLVEIYNLSEVEVTAGNTIITHTSLDEPSILTQEGDYLFAYYENEGYLLSYFGDDSCLSLPTSFKYNNVDITNYKIKGDFIANNDFIISIEIPGNVTELDKNAIRNYNNLVLVKINEGLEVIKGCNFDSCGKLEAIILPKSLKTIDAIFEGTENYTLFYLGDSNEWQCVSKNGQDYPIYFYNEDNEYGCWHYVDGVPTIWTNQ